MTNEEIRTIFFAECEEALASAERALTICKSQPDNMDAVNDVFRSVHSIKGGAGAFGYTALQVYTHGFETLLSDVRDMVAKQVERAQHDVRIVPRKRVRHELEAERARMPVAIDHAERRLAIHCKLQVSHYGLQSRRADRPVSIDHAERCMMD